MEEQRVLPVLMRIIDLNQSEVSINCVNQSEESILTCSSSSTTPGLAEDWAETMLDLSLAMFGLILEGETWSLATLPALDLDQSEEGIICVVQSEESIPTWPGSLFFGCRSLVQTTEILRQ